jgi:uncharacterized protein (DUF305 family)
MEKNNTVLFTGLAMLLVGGFAGYWISAGSENRMGMVGDRDSHSMHMMPNGETMTSGNASSSMQATMNSMNADLQGKTGDAFDQAFLSEMIAHHQGAVAMAQLALANAKHQEIKDLANGIIAAQNKEIGQMYQWQKAWYNQ